MHSEGEVQDVLGAAREHATPVTFRAAGTSLSGQAITDSVLLKLSHTAAWRRYKIEDEGKSITLEPGLIGGEVNRLLAAYKKKHGLPIQYKIGPGPASIESCMIGGIVANNSSGMCCGVKQNTYHTLRDMRVVLVDGTVLDTACAESRAAFEASHAGLLAKVSELAARVQGDADLLALINKKYAIKNTTGYSINALADFAPSDPIEIVKRLMIGSEGTLGFVSQVTYDTVVEHPFKASAFLIFSDIEEACDATTRCASTRASTRSRSSTAARSASRRRTPRWCGSARSCPASPRTARPPPSSSSAAAPTAPRSTSRSRRCAARSRARASRWSRRWATRRRPSGTTPRSSTSTGTCARGSSRSWAAARDRHVDAARGRRVRDAQAGQDVEGHHRDLQKVRVRRRVPDGPRARGQPA